MNSIHENYKIFWKDLYGETVEFEAIEDTYRSLYGEDLCDCLDRELAQEKLSSYVKNYEKYVALMKKLIESGDVAMNFGSAHMFQATISKEDVIAYFSKNGDEEEILAVVGDNFKRIY